MGRWVFSGPGADPPFGAKRARGGATDELPAPVSSVACGRACAVPATLAIAIAARTASTPASSVMVFLLKVVVLPVKVWGDSARVCPWRKQGWADARGSCGYRLGSG